MNRSSFDPDTLGTSGPECGRYMGLLLLMDTDFLSVDERAALREHLASCAACRVRLAAFAPVDAALHRYVDWLTLEAAQSSAWLTEEEIMRLAHENTDRSPIPVETSLHATRPPRPSSPNRFLSGLAAIAAVLLIALSATIFAWFGYGRLSHPGRVTQPPSCTPNQISAHLPKDVRLADLAMIAPDEGWAVGDTAPPTSTPVTSLLLHYSHCQWTPERVRLPGVAFYRISAVSANDVWVLGFKLTAQPDAQPPRLTSLIGHYTGGQWEETPFPISIADNQIIDGFSMVGADEGWTEVAQRGANGGTVPPLQLYHGVKGVWSRLSAPGYQNLWLVKAFAPGEAWLMGQQNLSGTQAVLLLYRDGTLTPLYALPPTAPLESGQIQMDDSHDAWVTFQTVTTHGVPAGWLVLHCSLSSCSQSSLVNDPRVQTSDTVWVFSAHEGWAFRSNNQQGAPADYAGNIQSVFRLHNGQWQSVPWPLQHIHPPERTVQIGPEEYWALGDHSILHFVNGAWSSYS